MVQNGSECTVITRSVVDLPKAMAEAIDADAEKEGCDFDTWSREALVAAVGSTSARGLTPALCTVAGKIQAKSNT
jgi:hypothetical protein